MPQSAALPPLDLAGLPLWLTERGLRGLSLSEQMDGFCRRLYEAGLPMKRVQMGMYTLHPRYGSHTFVWRPTSAEVEYTPRERSILGGDIYLRSPVHHMRANGLLKYRRRIGGGAGSGQEDFPIFAEFRAEGLTDYAAFIVPYRPEGAEPASGRGQFEGGIDGIFFSCATDRAEGFDEEQLAQLTALLPYLALAVKARLTYDVANTVLATYLGEDAGRRVFNGTIQRGSAEAISAVIWFADLRGFTRQADRLPPALLIETLNDHLEAVAAPLQARGGQVLKFMGDGLLGTFDLTGRETGDVCRLALEAAAVLRAGFADFTAARTAAGKPVMGFGLALHLGEVLYGNIGASDRLDFTVIGPAVNEASRIQALCRPLERNILVSASFAAAAGPQAPLEPLGFHALRGVREPQELFGLIR